MDDVPSFDDPYMEPAAQASPQPAEQSAGEKYKHPMAVTFHLLFKLVAIGLYVLYWMLSPSFVLFFILVVLMLAFDFWVTKNVSGRLLVGLRWWNEIMDNGDSVWQFESKAERSAIHKGEWTLFWGSTIVCYIVWWIFAITSILVLQRVIICIVAIIMMTANLYGYLRCARAASKLRKAAQGYATQTLVERTVGGGGNESAV